MSEDFDELKQWLEHSAKTGDLASGFGAMTAARERERALDRDYETKTDWTEEFAPFAEQIGLPPCTVKRERSGAGMGFKFTCITEKLPALGDKRFGAVSEVGYYQCRTRQVFEQEKRFIFLEMAIRLKRMLAQELSK